MIRICEYEFNFFIEKDEGVQKKDFISVSLICASENPSVPFSKLHKGDSAGTESITAAFVSFDAESESPLAKLLSYNGEARIMMRNAENEKNLNILFIAFLENQFYSKAKRYTSEFIW